MSRINTNVSSLIAQKTLGRSQSQLQESLTRLSTGLKINSGKDDPAGLIASEALRSDITAVNKAITNSDRANQFISTADSALGQVSSLLNDIRGLVTEAANGGVLSADQIAANQLQIDSSLEAIDRIAQTTQFQGKKLLDGSQAFQTAYTAGGATVRDLNVNQANLGSSGSLAVSVSVTSAATRGALTATVPSSGASSAAVAASSTLTFNDGSSIKVDNDVAGTSGNGTTIEIVDNSGTKASSTLTFDSGATLKVESTTPGTAGNGIQINIVNDPGVKASRKITFDNGVELTVQANTAGTAYNGTQIVFNDSVANTAGAAVANYSVGTNTITLDVNGNTNREVLAAAINGLAGGNFTATTSGTGAGYNATNDAGLVTTPPQLTGGVNSAAALNNAVAAFSGNTLTITTNGTVTKANLKAAVDLVSGFSATVGGSAGGYDPNNVNDANYVPSALSGGAAAAVTAGAASATYDSGLNKITLNLNGNTAKNVIRNALDGLSGFSATVVGGTGSGYVRTNDSAYTPAAFAGGAAAVAASGGLGAALTLKISGSTGSEIFQFNAGASITQVRDGINLLKDSTGVSASFSGTTLTLQSDAYGSKNAVAVEVISEGGGGSFGGSLSGTRAAGTDLAATVNGYQATADGNKLSLKNSTLDVSLTIADGSTTSVGFNISGGGATFQLGPDVVGNQQARIGITSVQTGTLGGVSGRLYELRAGNSKNLSADANGAALVVDEVINKITSLRGRLGAFQKTTLETNIASLNDTLSNLTQAESAIRDADFAQESAKLTRSQILVQSGNQVLQIANTQPQNVLSLLRG